MRYNSPNTPMDQIRRFIFRGGIPVTMTLVCVSVLIFLGSFFSQATIAPFVDHYLTFTPEALRYAPWTLLTYPLVFYFSLWNIVTLVFFWLSGGSLERSWGSQRYAAFFFAISAISALSLSLGIHLLHGDPIALAGFYFPLAAIIVAFCMLNPEQTVILYFFPVRAKYVALIVTAFLYFSFGPILGLFACGGVLAAVLYVRYGRNWASGSYIGGARAVRRGPDLRMDQHVSRPKPDVFIDGSRARRSPFDFAGRYRDWQERKRLERLWKNSGFSEPGTEEWRDDEKRRR